MGVVKIMSNILGLGLKTENNENTCDNIFLTQSYMHVINQFEYIIQLQRVFNRFFTFKFITSLWLIVSICY